jgi:hypothetical protein
MRKEFIQTETQAQAEDQAPWAAVIIAAEGGFMAFESQDDYAVWQNQK